jgi:DNA-binding NtrC family response regulator
MEKAYIEGVLKSVAWDKAAAAKMLGIGPKLLLDKIKAYKIQRRT